MKNVLNPCGLFVLALASACDPVVAGDALVPDAGIDPDAGQTGFDAGSHDTASDPTATDEQTDTPEAALAALVGHYVEKVRVSTLSSVPGAGTQASTSIYFGITEVTEEGGAVVASSISCRSLPGSVAGVTVTISDELTQLIPPLVGEITARVEDGVILFDRETVVMPLGVELTDPVNEALPTSADDPRVIDADGDGHPGVSIGLSMLGISGQIYAVRKEIGSWSVAATADGTWEGPFNDASEQQVIGASRPLFDQNLSTAPDPDPLKSRILLQRTAEAYDCARLLAELDTLFR